MSKVKQYDERGVLDEAWVVVQKKKSGPALAKVRGECFYLDGGEARSAWASIGEERESWEVCRILVSFPKPEALEGR